MPEQKIFRHRFVIHLPTLDNDGKRINLYLIKRAFRDLEKRFGGYTTSSYIGYPNYYGFYRDPDGKTFTDYIYLIYVDVEDSEKAIEAIIFFEKFRQKYMKLFRQSEVYIIYYPVTKVD